MVSLVYILSTKVDLCHIVHKLAIFSSNRVKFHFESLVHLLRYIKDNENLEIKHYSVIELMVLSYSIFQDFLDTGRSTGLYMVFYQSVPIDNCTHVTDPVIQYSAKSDYNAACTAGMYSSHFIMLNNEMMNKDPDLVPEQSPIIILDKNQLCVWTRILRTPRTPDIFPEEFIL